MSSPRPSRAEAWARLRAAEPPTWVLDHVASVEALAVAMARQAARNGHIIDEDLVQIGAALHDIGRSITQNPTHAVRGAALLAAEGYPEDVVAIVACHTGAGLTDADAEALGIPALDLSEFDLIPRTLEQQIVAHADNLYSGSKRLTLADVRAKYAAKRLPDAWARIEALHGHLGTVLGMDPDDIEPADLAISGA